MPAAARMTTMTLRPCAEYFGIKQLWSCWTLGLASQSTKNIATTRSYKCMRRALKSFAVGLLFFWKSNGIQYFVWTRCHQGEYFPKTPLSQRDTRDVEFKIADTYIGPRGCGIYVLSDWQLAATKKTNGWNTVAFPTDDFLSNLTKIGNESEANGLSNELQRFYNILKITVGFLVPSSVNKVTFGDWKCNVVGFHQDSERSHRSSISDFEVVKHFRFGKSLGAEWVDNHKHVSERQDWAALRDIDRLKLFLGPNVTKLTVNMADIMCTTWHLGRKRQALARFALRWFWYTAAFTMRPQLTYNLAMFDCGESLAVNYLKQSWYCCFWRTSSPPTRSSTAGSNCREMKHDNLFSRCLPAAIWAAFKDSIQSR